MTQFANYPSLRDRVVFITGGASGIGAAIVTQFCAQGSRVAFVDKDADSAQQLIADIALMHYPAPLFIPCDLQHIATLKAAVAQATAELGDISVLIDNAANDERHTTRDTTESKWRDIMAHNLDHQFFAAQA